MKNKTRLLSLLLALPLFLSGCGGTPAESSQPGTSGGPTSSEPAGATVTGVTITGADELTVLDGTRASLKATVSGSEGVSQKVKWSTSNESVATVTNGVVNFLKVSEETKVTITAKAQADETKSASVEFTVNHSPFDLKNSRGNPDYSLYLDDGSFIVEDPQDIALIYADVHDTRWYVEATLQIDSFDMTDAYPKVGIMASERDDGMWCYEQSRQVFYYLDSVSAAKSWSNMNAVPENNDRVDWDWGHQLSAVTASPAAKMGEPFKMGLMRDGNTFYQLYGKAEDLTLKCLGSFEYEGFGDNANYVWVGGWKTGMTISDPKCIVGDGIDALFEVPEGLSLKSTEEVVFLGDSYQIEVTNTGFWNRNKLRFTSSDETIATVNAKGLVTASAEKTGIAEITVSIEGTEISTKFRLEVTDDVLFNVVLDGEMNDAIWSNTVKANFYLLKKNASNYIKIYAAKNSRGLYMFMDYVVGSIKVGNPNEWWTYDNCEFYLADNGLVWGGQYWLSAMDGGRFVSVGSGEKAEKIFYKPLAVGDDQLYHGAFELFVPFGDDKLTKDQATYARFGFNPAAGWQASYNWEGQPTVETLAITANGFAHGEETCAQDQHLYGGWVIDAEATAEAAGSKHRDCIICGHREVEAIEYDPGIVYETVVIDGEMTDAVWNDTVKTNAFLLKNNDKNYIRIYATKLLRGVYMYMEYVVGSIKAGNPNEWWTWDNCEFYLADDALAWSGQYWLSAMDGGRFVSVGTNQKEEAVAYKALELGNDGVYHAAFELFIPFGDDRCVENQATYVRYGFNPAAGWKASYNWDNQPSTDTLAITANGFVRGEHSCGKDGHTYGDWIVDVAATCSTKGSQHRECSWCGHHDVAEIEIDANAHKFDYKNATVSKEPTCSETGIGTATCELCGAIDETVLPKDYTNHSDEEFGKSHAYCHGCGVGSYLANAEGDAYNAHGDKGNWDDKSTWYDIGIIKGDFTFTFEFNMRACINGNPSVPGDTCWRTILPILYKEGWQSDAATGNRVDHVFRMDWAGWDDGQFTSVFNNGGMPAGFDWGINSQAFSNMDVKLVITKSGADVTLDWIWVCNATEGYYLGKTYEYHQSCTLLDGSQVGLALTAEWTTATITKASLAR